MRIAVTCFFAVFLIAEVCFADVVFYLKNGDRLRGMVIGENNAEYEVKTENFGELKIRKGIIKKIKGLNTEKEGKGKENKKVKWKRQISVSYRSVRGNTNHSRLGMKVYVNRKTDRDEATFKSSISQTTSDKKTDSQKWRVMGRYAFSFGREKKWYNFYRVDFDHEKFSNIDYRVTPFAGIGYWVSDKFPFKMMSEIGAGSSYTEYNDGTSSTNDAILIPRIFFAYKFYEKAVLSEEVSVTVPMNSIDEYMLKSETVLEYPIAKGVSFKFSFLNEYDADPAGDADKLDQTVTSSLAYTF